MNCIKTKKNKAFTLVELLVVIAIVAILATVSVIGYTSFVKKAANSNDNVLAKQINTLIEGQKVYEDIDTENDIAKLLQQHFGTSVEIASEKYGMNVYYNTDSNRFELMSNENNAFKTINYYLSLQVVENSTPDTPDLPHPDEPDEPDSPQPDAPDENEIVFIINTSYRETFDGLTIITPNDTRKTLEAYFIDNNLYIEIGKNYMDNEPKIPTIDLASIISATDSNGNLLDISNISIEEVSLVDNQSPSYDLQDNALKVFSAGKYKIKYTFQDKEGSLDLYVKNVYFTNAGQIDTSALNLTYRPTNNSIEISNINNILICEYNLDTGIYEENLEISEKKYLLNNMDIILIINGVEEYPSSMSESKTKYTVSLDEYELSDDSTIEIKFRYLSYNGEYRYSDIYTVTIN